MAATGGASVGLVVAAGKGVDWGARVAAALLTTTVPVDDDSNDDFIANPMATMTTIQATIAANDADQC